MKKAFTLVELMGVIIILGIIAVIIIPTVNRDLKKAKETLYQSQVKNIENGASNWSVDHIGLLSETSIIKLTLWQLKQDGYVKDDITNPKTDEYFPNDMVVNISYKNGDYVFDLDEESGTSYYGQPGNYPYLDLNGEAVIKLSNGLTYTELGAIATVNNVIVDSSNITISGTVDINTNGVYYKTYSITNNNYTSSVIRTIIVSD